MSRVLKQFKINTYCMHCHAPKSTYIKSRILLRKLRDGYYSVPRQCDVCGEFVPIWICPLVIG